MISRQRIMGALSLSSPKKEELDFNQQALGMEWPRADGLWKFGFYLEGNQLHAELDPPDSAKAWTRFQVRVEIQDTAQSRIIEFTPDTLFHVFPLKLNLRKRELHWFVILKALCETP